jgi:hypothetical protein
MIPWKHWCLYPQSHWLHPLWSLFGQCFIFSFFFFCKKLYLCTLTMLHSQRKLRKQSFLKTLQSKEFYLAHSFRGWKSKQYSAGSGKEEITWPSRTPESLGSYSAFWGHIPMICRSLTGLHLLKVPCHLYSAKVGIKLPNTWTLGSKLH